MRFAAVDLGASSGRVMVGEVGPDTLRLTAAARFPNEPVRTEDGLHWDVEALVDHAVAGLATAYAAGPLARSASTPGRSTTAGSATVGCSGSRSTTATSGGRRRVRPPWPG